MKRAKFEIRRSDDYQWYFVLIARNGETIAQSEMYTSPAMCRKGIRSVRLNAPIAKLVDKT